MTNSKQEYNDFVRANLPGSIRYDSVRNRYVTANNKYFVTYKEAKWYVDYLVKRGSNLAYAEGGYTPSTILDYSGQKSYVGGNLTSSFDDVVTASRTGLATQLDASGNLVWNAHNLLTYSEDFSNAAWVKTSANIGANAIIAPDGTTTAELIESSGGGTGFSSVETQLLTVFPAKHTFSCFLKAGSSSWVALRQSAFGLGVTYSYFNLSTGALGTNSNDASRITDFGNGWYLCEIDVTISSSDTVGRFAIFPLDEEGNFSYPLDGSVSVYAWGAHLYRSDLGGMAPVPLTRRVAGSTTYVPTTSAAVYLPREEAYTYVSGSLVGPYYQKESASATNLLLNSDNLESQTVQLTPGEDYTLSFTSGNSVVDIDASIAATAVDVFVYDTSKDSDGGAWAAGYPNQMVIVAEAASVKIYDATSASLTLHTTLDFTGYTVKALAAVSGVLSVGTTTGLATLNLADGDTTVALDYTTSTTPAIVNNTVNDVAMTILPDAPIDAATGLPVPTIAVATDGGVSVIKDDGTVVDFVSSAGALGYEHYFTSFDPDKNLFAVHSYAPNGSNATLQVFLSSVYPNASDRSADTDNGDLNWGLANSATSYDYPSLTGTAGSSTGHNMQDAVATGSLACALVVGGSKPKLTRFKINQAAPEGSMVAYTTSTYNTGWMNGDIKGAFLSDTDDTDLVGSEIYGSDFSSGVDGWTAEAQGTLAAVSSELELTGDGGYNDTARKALTVVSGKRYIITGKFRKGTNATARVQIQEAFGSFLTIDSFETNSASLVDFKLEFVASGTSYNLKLVDWTGGGGTCYIKDVSVQLADEDRSVNQNGIVINGTVTRSPVATGADLVAYSGFSASNYLEQPYNPDLDFGTGDFSVMGWGNVNNAGASKYIIARASHDGTSFSGAGIVLRFDGSEFPVFTISDDGFATSDSATYTSPTTGRWAFLVGVRRGSSIELYVDGTLVATTTITAATGSLNNASAVLSVGNLSGALTVPMEGSLALIRISATAPSPEQIKKIYNDEKVLFQDNAACTLYGTSDAVTALAHDPDTDLLHVGTSAGRSVFYGLRRINNTTTPVTTAISAANGIIGEQ